jgi:hypothetical protein
MVLDHHVDRGKFWICSTLACLARYQLPSQWAYQSRTRSDPYSSGCIALFGTRAQSTAVDQLADCWVRCGTSEATIAAGGRQNIDNSVEAGAQVERQKQAGHNSLCPIESPHAAGGALRAAPLCEAALAGAMRKR